MPEEKTRQGIKTINEEAGLGENWVPVDAPPIVPGRNNPAPPPPPGTLYPQTPQYLQGSIPPGFQHDTSFVDTATLTPNAPKFSLMPLGIQANPVSNAAIQSTASKTSPPSKSGKIELQVPNIFTPIDQTVDLPGPLVLALADEPANYVFAGPSGTGSGSGIDADVTSFVYTANPSISITPSTYPELVVASVGSYSGLGTPIVGWTQMGPAGGASYFGYQEVASGTATLPVDNGNAAIATGMILVAYRQGGGTTTLVQAASNYLGSFPGTIPVTFSSSVTSGNTIILHIAATQGTGSGSIGTVTVTDNVGNVYANVASLEGSLVGGAYVSQWCCISAIGGNIVIDVASTSNVVSNVKIVAAELTNVVKAPGVPTFRALVGADLPNPSLTSKGGVFANAAVAHEFVTQIDTNGEPVLGQPAYADLTGDPSLAPAGTFLGDVTTLASGTTYTTQVADRGHMLILPSTAPSTFTVTLSNNFYGWFLNNSNTVSVDLQVGPIATHGMSAYVSLAAGESAFVIQDNNLLYQIFLSGSGGGGTPFYQTVQEAGSAKAQEAVLNFLSPIMATDNPGNTSTDISISDMVGDSGAGGTHGLVPAPAAGSAAAGEYLKADGTWDTPPGTGGAAYYQTVQQAGSSKTQEPKLNFLAPITATDDGGNTSTDIAVPVFAASGASHAIGLVPDPGASSGTTKFLREDATWQVPAGGGTSANINADTHPSSPTAYDDEFETGSLSGQWTQVGSPALTFLSGSVVFTQTGNGSDVWQLIVETSPSAPYTVAAKIGFLIPAFNYVNCALIIRDSGTGKIIMWGPSYNSGWLAAVQRYTNNTYNSTSYSVAFSGLASFGFPVTEVPSYWAISDDGVNYNYQISLDGIIWSTLYSESHTAWLTANQIGLGIDEGANTKIGKLSVDWIRRTA